MPKVSVIIATHSRPHLLIRAVESAFAAGTDVEVIVVDDASIDETADVCQHLKNIKYIRVERNQRVAGARNLGILASTSDYITFHDDDDLRLPNSLDKQTSILDKNPDVALVYGKCLLGNDNCVPQNDLSFPDECKQGDIFWDILAKNFISCGTAVFRKNCLYKIGLLEKDLYRIDDWDLWIRLAEIYPFKAVEEPVYIWRGATPHSQQGTSDMDQMLLLASRTYKHRWLELPRAKRASVHQRNEVFAKAMIWMTETLIWEGIAALKEKNLSTAMRNFSAAISIRPKLFFHPITLFHIIKHSLINLSA